MNRPLRRLSAVVALLFLALFTSTTYVQFVRADELRAMPGNSRQLYAELGRERGDIIVAGDPVAQSVPVDDSYGFLRTYPAGPTYAHVTGYHSIRYGTSGLERAMNDVLSGTADRLFYRRVSDLLTGAEPRGASVETTIDPEAQRVAAEALGERRGAVVALDPATGAVLAMVSHPTYDPNELAGHDPEELAAAWERLTTAPGNPLVNRALAGDLYPPGSTFKIVTAAAALESGDYTPDSVLPGPAVLDLPQTTADLPNSDGRACGSDDRVTLTRALEVSCNTTFGHLGMELGEEALRERAAAFGFGQRLSVPLPVTASSVPEGMNAPQLAQSGIGQFDVRVTPLQVAMISAAIANDGVLVRPNLVRAVRDADLDVIDEPGPQELGRAVSADTAAALAEMMRAVVESGTGTRAQIPGASVAGKTGTAQHGEGRAPHAWFTGFAEDGERRVAVAVVVEDGGGAGDSASGGRLAAPVARQVMEAVLDG